MPVGVALPWHDFETRHRAADNQRLAAADEDVEALVVLRNDSHADVARQLANRLVTSVEQIVGLLTICRGDGDRFVQAANAACQPVYLIGDSGHLLVGEIVLLGEPVIDRVETPRQTLCFSQNQLTCRDIRRVLGSSLQGRKELLQRGRDAGGSAGQQRIELIDLALVSLHIRAQRSTTPQLAGEEFAIATPNLHQRGPRAYIPGAAELRRAGSLACVLPAIARRVDVGDVVAGDGQLGLAGGQAGKANAQ